MQLQKYLLHGIMLISLNALNACLFSPEKSKALSSDHGTTLQLNLKPSALTHGTAGVVSTVDSVKVEIVGDSMNTLNYTFLGSLLSPNIYDLPAGLNRHIKVNLFHNGHITYLGESTVDFPFGKKVEVTLKCAPQFSRITAFFHLPNQGPLISSGELFLKGSDQNYATALEKQGEFAFFHIEDVVGNLKYTVALILKDVNGKIIYRADDAGFNLNLGEQVSLNLPLIAQQASAGFSLQLLPTPQAELAVSFPSSIHNPLKSGDLIISELYVSPATKDSGDKGEWFEIANRSADTLKLNGCRITRDRNSQAISKSLDLSLAENIAPEKAITWGKSAAPSQFHYADFNLTESLTTLYLLCAQDTLTLDSLRYSPSISDSLAIQIKTGWVSTLNHRQLENRQAPKSWCYSSQADTASVKATPRSLWSSCTE